MTDRAAAALAATARALTSGWCQFHPPLALVLLLEPRVQGRDESKGVVRHYLIIRETLCYTHVCEVKTQHGHWVCWMSTGGKNGLMRTKHTHTYNALILPSSAIQEQHQSSPAVQANKLRKLDLNRFRVYIYIDTSCCKDLFASTRISGRSGYTAVPGKESVISLSSGRYLVHLLSVTRQTINTTF